MATPNDYEAQADNAEHLRDSLESAWDAGEAVAAEKQVAADVVASEIDRRDPSERELYGAAYDAAESRARAREEGADPEREPGPEYADPQDRRGIRKSLNEQFDKAAKADDANASLQSGETAPAKADNGGKPGADTKSAPEEANGGDASASPAEAGWSAEDRAALDSMTPEARQWAEAKAAETRATYGGVDALAGKWGGYLSQIGADTPERQVGALDRLLSTEHALRTGTPQQRAAILSGLAREYGVGTAGSAPAAPAPEPGPAPHPLQQAALATPQADPEAQAAAARERLEAANKQIADFAGEKDESGHPKHALLGAVMPEMMEAVRMIQAAGHPVDLPTAYKAAVAYARQRRPGFDQAVYADARGKVDAFKYRNPVAADPRLMNRMASLTKADMRINGTADLKSVMDRALKLEPEIAARQAAHAAKEKALGFKTPRPSLRQLLEAGYDRQAAA